MVGYNNLNHFTVRLQRSSAWLRADIAAPGPANSKDTMKNTITIQGAREHNLKTSA